MSYAFVAVAVSMHNVVGYRASMQEATAVVSCSHTGPLFTFSKQGLSVIFADM